MPRGNDADAAGAELKAKIGADANAEDLIKANAERWPADLRAAQRKPIDDAATNAIDESDVEKHIDNDSVLLAYAVRGKHIVAVSEDEDGLVHKSLVALADLGKAVERKIDKARADDEPSKGQPQTTAAAAEAGTRS